MASFISIFSKIVTTTCASIWISQIVVNFIFSFSFSAVVSAIYTAIPLIALICVEFNIFSKFTQLFGFLYSFIGRGLFMVMVGLIFYNHHFPDLLWSVAFWVVAAIYMTVGVLQCSGKVQDDDNTKPDVV